MKTDELDFELPSELIAQSPRERRADSRLLHYVRSRKEIHHRTFSDLPGLLRPGDVLVFNDSQVIPARFALRKSTGGLVEGLFLSQPAPGQWLVLMRSVGNARRGTVFSFDAEPGLRAAILAARGEGEYLLEIAGNASAVEVLGRVGRMPMPPYIKRAKMRDPQDDLDRRRYQTVYASAPGAVAAPTAGLHFTPELLAELASRQIHRVMVTLHVGMGTFKPIAVQTLADHPMHTETYSISEAAADALNLAKKEKRRIVGVGTTAARVLESQDADRPFEACSKETAIFIYPPYAWKHVGALVTNFHLPRSTLIALVAAMTGLTEQKRIYAEAIAERYRFFSYGDAMFID